MSVSLVTTVHAFLMPLVPGPTLLFYGKTVFLIQAQGKGDGWSNAET